MRLRLLTWFTVVALASLPAAVLAAPDDGAGERRATAAPAAITRAAGTDRIATAIELSRSAFVRASAAVVADAGGFADALAAAPLAAAVGGPVLLNPAAGLDGRVAAELDRLGVSRVFLMGGPNAQSAAVESGLRDRGLTVTRLSGRDRYATAAAAADAAQDAWPAGTASRTVIVALGEHPVASRAWPDALAAGALAGHARRSILLVRPDGVPDATRQAITDLGAQAAVVVGGRAAIPDAVAQQLGVPFERLGGATRYETAALLAGAAVSAGADPSTLVVATGGSFADALAAGPAAVASDGVVVLVDGRDLDASGGTRDWLVGRRGTVASATVAGGRAAVDDPVLGQLRWAVDGWTPPTLRRVAVVTGLSTPLELTAPPGDDRLFIAERPGRIRVVDDGRVSTFLDITSRVRDDGERGLLGLAFPPDHATSGRFFVHYSRASDGATILAEYRTVPGDPGRADPDSQVVQLRVDQPASNHNGGTLAFAPDGMLHLFLGDGGGSDDRFANGQDPGTLLGAELRLDVRQPGQYRIPADNPFADGRGGAPEVVNYGLRNPYRSAFDAVTNTLYIADVGQNTWEEVDAVSVSARGLNFGWPVMEGDHCFGGRACDPGAFTRPVLEYDHGDGCSITGGQVHRGEVGMLRGHYLYGDFCTGIVRSFRLVDGRATEQTDWTSALGGSNVYSFGRDGLGRTYLLTSTTVWRITD